MPVTIKTNHHMRPFVYRYDVPADVLASDFDWTDEDDTDGFFRYRGVWYHVSMFTRIPELRDEDRFNGWHGIHNDSFFSGVVIALSSDGEEFRVGTYYHTSASGDRL